MLRKLMLEALEDRLTPTPMPAFLPTPAPTPPSLFQAALTLFMDGAHMAIDVYEHDNQAVAGVQASIALNFPYAGPFAELFLQSGEFWVAEQIPGGNNPAFKASLGLGL